VSPHTSTRRTAENHRLSFTVLDHQSYVPDLAPSNFHLFPKLNKYLRRHHLLSGDEVKSTVKTWFRQQDEQLYGDGLMKLSERWRKCVDSRSDYVEK
jgi:hypothetical protein